MHGTFFFSKQQTIISRLSSKMDSQEYITVCQLMRAHGVKGYIKAMPLTHDLNRCKSLKNVRVQKRNGEIVELTLEDAKVANDIWHLKFKGFDSPGSSSSPRQRRRDDSRIGTSPAPRRRILP